LQNKHMANIKEFSYNGHGAKVTLFLPIVMEPDCATCSVIECSNCALLARGRSEKPTIRYNGPEAVTAAKFALCIANCQPLKQFISPEDLT